MRPRRTFPITHVDYCLFVSLCPMLDQGIERSISASGAGGGPFAALPIELALLLSPLKGPDSAKNMVSIVETIIILLSYTNNWVESGVLEIFFHVDHTKAHCNRNSSLGSVVLSPKGTPNAGCFSA
jgi:hypothetical protein